MFWFQRGRFCLGQGGKSEAMEQGYPNGIAQLYNISLVFFRYLY